MKILKLSGVLTPLAVGSTCLARKGVEYKMKGYTQNKKYKIKKFQASSEAEGFLEQEN